MNIEQINRHLNQQQIQQAQVQKFLLEVASRIYAGRVNSTLEEIAPTQLRAHAKVALDQAAYFGEAAGFVTIKENQSEHRPESGILLNTGDDSVSGG